MKSGFLSQVARASLATTLFGAIAFVASPALAQEEACAPPTIVETPPPPLPTYDQPPPPASGHIWAPGYWRWSADQNDYYWVPGTWAEPPKPGLLWTPGYWGWVAGAYVFHTGYWGPHVGFYGGVAYGYGYTGHGYAGGRWDHGVFFYNRAVNNLGNVPIRNVYEEKITINNTTNNISFNGGKGGIEERPTDEDRNHAKERHFAPTPLQRQHVETASKDPSLLEKTNHGAPAVAATPRPAELKGPGVAPARAAGTQPNAPATGQTPAADEKKPAAGAAQPNGEKPATEEEKPAIGGAEQGGKKPRLDRKEKLEQKEKTAPSGDEAKPATEQNPPVNEEKKPALGGNKPAVEEKKSEQPAKAEPIKPEPKMQRRERAAPAPHDAPSAAQPPARPEAEKKKLQP